MSKVLKRILKDEIPPLESIDGSRSEDTRDLPDAIAAEEGSAECDEAREYVATSAGAEVYQLERYPAQDDLPQLEQDSDSRDTASGKPADVIYLPGPCEEPSLPGSEPEFEAVSGDSAASEEVPEGQKASPGSDLSDFAEPLAEPALEESSEASSSENEIRSAENFGLPTIDLSDEVPLRALFNRRDVLEALQGDGDQKPFQPNTLDPEHPEPPLAMKNETLTQEPPPVTSRALIFSPIITIIVAVAVGSYFRLNPPAILKSEPTPVTKEETPPDPKKDLTPSEILQNNEAVSFYWKHKYAEAAERFAKLLEAHPDSYYLHLNLGVTYLRLGKAKLADKHLNEAVKLNDQVAAAWNNLGAYHLEVRKHREAADDFKMALTVDPEAIDAHLNLGKSLELSWKPRDAIQAYETYMRHERSDPILKKMLRKRITKLQALARVLENQEEKQ